MARRSRTLSADLTEILLILVGVSVVGWLAVQVSHAAVHLYQQYILWVVSASAQAAQFFDPSAEGIFNVAPVGVAAGLVVMIAGLFVIPVALVSGLASLRYVTSFLKARQTRKLSS